MDSQEPNTQGNAAPGSSQQNSDTKRVNVIFSSQQYQMLKDLAERQGVSISDVLRQALALTKLIAEAERNDQKFLIEKDGQYQQVRFVR
jgi:ribbon-helix-helix protein